MPWNHWIRRFHRALSIAFTLAVVINIMVQGQETLARWVGMLTLLPLALLLLTGLCMFVQPYIARWRRARSTDGREDPLVG